MGLIMFVAIFTIVTPATADIIYNNLSSGYQTTGLDPLVNVVGTGVTFMNYQWNAVTFTPSDNFTLSQLTLPLARKYDTYSAKALVKLVEDSSGFPGASALKSWTIDTLSLTPSLVTLIDADSTQLYSGTKYWVAIYPSELTTIDCWFYSFENGNWAYGGNWGKSLLSNSITPGLKVEGIRSTSTVPIPPTVWLLGAGLVGIAGLRRKFFRK